MKAQIYLNEKKSGNLIVSEYTRPEWKVKATCFTPKQLLEEVRSYGFKNVIKSEYSKSQLTCIAKMYTTSDALKAFGLSANKANLEKYFNFLITK